RPDVFRDETDDLLGNRELEMIEVRLLPENRDAMLEIGHFDVGDHAPLKAADESRLESGDLGRWSVAREHDLPAAFVERVERVKELLLHRLLPFQEMDVVDEEKI